MRILIVYGTTEGHTRELAQFIAERLTQAHHGVAIHDASETPLPSPDGFHAVIVAASLHLGHYQRSVLHFARQHRDVLNDLPGAFISVSLAAAGDDAADWAGLKTCEREFEQETRWKPRMIHYAAGAIRFSAYDFFRKLALKYIALRRGQHVSTSEDYDYTDYEALGRFVDGFVAEAGAAPALQPR